MEVDFNNHILYTFKLFGTEIWITESIFNSWLIMAALITFALIVKRMSKKFTSVPGALQNLLEICVELMEGMVRGSMGEKYVYFSNWFFGLFAFILACNLSGLVGLRPPTADLATTAGFAVSSFFLIHFMGIKKSKVGYFKEYISPVPFFLPIHLIGEIATPVSLSFRMFGNILGGMVILELIYDMFPKFLLVGMPSVLHIYFDVFAGFLQAFIFCMLSMTFIGNKIIEEH